MSHVPLFAGRAVLSACRRLVVKVGSALLAGSHGRVFARLAQQVALLQAQGRQVVLVSSGAIALGLEALALSKRPQSVTSLQAAAAAGQPELMRRWGWALRKHGLQAAQVLLTYSDLNHRERFLNARRTLSKLLEHHLIPIVNENDSVATEEIRVGDNDQLSSQTASLLDADLLIILTSVNGLHTADPESDSRAQRLAVVYHPDTVASLGGHAGRSGLGVGGMRTKIQAARIAVNRGIAVVIAAGQQPHILSSIVSGADVGTLFIPITRMTDRKHWIGFTLKPQGQLYIDAGAAYALQKEGKSLLSCGLVRVEGHFSRGSMVDVVGPQGPVARGLVTYSADEMTQLCGRSSHEIGTILGYIDIPEVVHRDDLVLLTREGMSSLGAVHHDSGR